MTYQRYAILWILPYAVILSIPELIMDLIATSRNFVNTIHEEATLLYDDYLDDASETDATVTSDAESYTVRENDVEKED